MCTGQTRARHYQVTDDQFLSVLSRENCHCCTQTHVPNVLQYLRPFPNWKLLSKIHRHEVHVCCCNSALHTGKQNGNRVVHSLHCVLSGQSRFQEVSAMDEIMLYGVCQQHYLTSLSLISRAQGGAHLFVRLIVFPGVCTCVLFACCSLICVHVCAIIVVYILLFSSSPLSLSESAKNNIY